MPSMLTTPTANHAIYAKNANHVISFGQYYGENYFKGGVFTQLYGWQGVVDLWTSAVNYNRREGYLEKQKQFQEKDLVKIHNTQQNRVSKEVVPFLKYLCSLSPCNWLINNSLLFLNGMIK